MRWLGNFLTFARERGDLVSLAPWFPSWLPWLRSLASLVRLLSLAVSQGLGALGF